MMYYQQFPTQTANDLLSIHSSQHRLQMMYYQYTVPNSFYELKYNVTVYEQFFYDDLVPTMLPCTIYSHVPRSYRVTVSIKGNLVLSKY